MKKSLFLLILLSIGNLAVAMEPAKSKKPFVGANYNFYLHVAFEDVKNICLENSIKKATIQTPYDEDETIEFEAIKIDKNFKYPECSLFFKRKRGPKLALFKHIFSYKVSNGSYDWETTWRK